MYPDPWVDFLNKFLGTAYRDLNEAKERVSYKAYKDIKYNYRECGIKATLPVRPGAAKLTKSLKDIGYTILVITSRPFDEHKSLYKQTTDWLDAKSIVYDGLIFGKDKHIQVLTQAPHLRFMVEDHRYYANLVSQWGYKVFLVNSKYNQGEEMDRVYRINDLSEILRYNFVKEGGDPI
jgi:uncharacterized HAD superfamily protein